MKIIAIVSAKGGVGKTTFSANLSMAMARAGVPTLSVDLDPQDALHLHFGLSMPCGDGLVEAALTGMDWRHALLQTDFGCDLMPYGQVEEEDREAFEHLLREQPLLLRQRLESLNLPEDAVVILDTPPGPSVYLTQALSAANMALIVVLSDAASYATLPSMVGLIQRYCLNRNDFSEYAYLVNQVDHSRQLNSDVAYVMRTQFGKRALGLVHQDQAIPEALACNQFVCDYDQHSRGAADLKLICEQLLARLALSTQAAA
jgi:cellulose synthase operon protein YhjQ